MKFASLAILALINNIQAIKLSDDLFDDESEAVETMQSLHAAEKAHNKKMSTLDAED